MNASIAGDDVCGAAASCDFSSFKTIIMSIFALILSLSLPLVVVFVSYNFIIAYFKLQQGDANAYKTATNRVLESLKGFLIIVVIFGGIFLTILKVFGVRSDDGGDFNPLHFLQQLFTFDLISHAYAATGDGAKMLPNPLNIDNLYDFILAVLNLFMKFIVYPGLIIMWVMTGFSYILAQGAPEKIVKAHRLLMWAVVTTFLIFFIQTFLVAIRGTVKKILPNALSISIPAKDIENRGFPVRTI